MSTEACEGEPGYRTVATLSTCIWSRRRRSWSWRGRAVVGFRHKRFISLRRPRPVLELGLKVYPYRGKERNKSFPSTPPICPPSASPVPSRSRFLLRRCGQTEVPPKLLATLVASLEIVLFASASSAGMFLFETSVTSFFTRVWPGSPAPYYYPSPARRATPLPQCLSPSRPRSLSRTALVHSKISGSFRHSRAQSSVSARSLAFA
ncbi:hypothetical protein B0H13DRAFT_2040006 [Mycena leptocephala]|nr:hypothetical protein B0H13DRAFT_2040006 [Mycena leptocephala]